MCVNAPQTPHHICVMFCLHLSRACVGGAAPPSQSSQNQGNLARARALGGGLEYDDVAVVGGRSPRKC